MTGKHGEVTAVCGTPLETFYRSAYASPMRDDDHIGKRALDGVEGRRRVRETCRMIAERHGLTPPRSRRGLWALLVDRFGEAKGRQIMRGAKLAVPKPKTVRRPWSAAAKQRHSEKLKFIHAMRRQESQPQPPAAPRHDAADAADTPF